MKIPRKCHNHEARSSRQTKGMSDEEQIKTKQTPNKKKKKKKKTPTHKQRRAATENPSYWESQATDMETYNDWK